jgi:hypothetical protein
MKFWITSDGFSLGWSKIFTGADLHAKVGLEQEIILLPLGAFRFT